MAIASLICGCLFFLFPVPVAAIVLGHLALSEIRKSAGKLKGQGMAIAGLVLGYGGVVFIPFILIIAAIAIPNLLRAKMAANEAVAVGSVRTYNTALAEYAAKCADQGYPASNTNLGPGNGDCERANLVDARLGASNPVKSGYVFFYQAGTRDDAGHITHYTINADPFQGGVKGVRHFFTDETGVIRYEIDRPADKDSSPLDQVAPTDIPEKEQ